MKLKYSILLASILAMSSTSVFSQDKINGEAGNQSVRTGQAAAFGRADDAFTQQALRDENARAGRLAPPKLGEVNNHQIPPKLRDNATRSSSSDGVQVNSGFSPQVNAPSVNVSTEGYGNDDNASLFGFRITPPDTNGDVGLTHYVQYINLGWMVFDKATGNPAGGPFAGNSFWQGFGGVCETENAGDPIVIYDHLAGRWLFSQFTGTSIADGHQCVALSDGEDPLGPYTLYDFVVSPNGFNDYPKITVWPDGYYMTTHEFVGQNFAGVNLTVFDRDEMLAGNPNAGFIQFTGTNLEFGTQVGHLEGNDLPPAGSCNYLLHATDAESFGLTGSDRYQFWKACVDFNNPSSSSLTQLSSINVPEFDQNFCNFSRDCIDQNSSNANRLDALAGFTIYRFSNRYFPAEGLLRTVATTNVDIGGDQAGVMWAGFEINPTNDAHVIADGGAQLGTIDFNDSLNRWMGSASLDQNGNIGIGYTVAGPGTFPSIAITVHERGVDGPGQVQGESFCVVGSGATTGANRWADYASTSVDPVDGCTFWHTNEYVETTGNFEWNTRVCSFAIPSCGGGGPVNIPPSASFTDNCTDLSCNFDGSASSDSDGSIVSYAWSFGDGGTDSGVSVAHTYAASGTFNVSLTVTDDGGATNTTTRAITVTDPGNPTISLSTSPANRGRVNLNWSGATTNRVDIFRNGSFLRRTRNDGSFRDRPGNGTFTYQICEQGSTTACSNLSTITI